MFIIRLILFCFLFFYSMTCFANSKLYVQQIKILGLHHISKINLINDFKINKNELISYQKVKNIVDKLYKTNFFNHIKVFKKNNNLIFLFYEKRIIGNVIIQGNKQCTRYTIYNNLKLYGCEKFHIFDISKINQLKSVIQNLYYKNNIYNTKIDIKYNILKNNYVILKIKIFEGSQVKLKNIYITGNNTVNSKKIITLFNIYPNFFKNFVLHNKKYNFVSLKNDLINLKNFYYQNGYMYFIIKNIQLNLLKNKKDIYINLNIQENQKFLLHSIIIHGNINGYTSQLKKEIDNIHFNTTYNYDKILYINKKLKELFLNLGFLKCQFFFKTCILNVHDKNIILHIYIYPGKKYIIQNIQVHGNHFVDISKVQKIIHKITIGSYVNLNIVKNIQKNLQNIQYVQNVKFKIVSSNISSNYVNIIYYIHEYNNNILNINLGYNLLNGLNVHLKLIHQNWLGYKIKSIIHIIHSNYHHNIDLLYEYPYLIHHTIFSNHIFYDDIQHHMKNVIFYKHKIYGIEAKTKFVFSEKQNMQLIFGYIVNHIIDLNHQLIFWNHTQQLEHNINNFIFEHNHYSNIMVTYLWIYDNIPHVHFPYFGKKINFNIKFSLPIGYNNFHKEMFYFEQYFPISKYFKYILHTRFHMGFGKNFNYNRFPFYENFYFHEENNVRGFLDNSIGPELIHYNINHSNNFTINKLNIINTNYVVGGNAFILSKIDLIIPNFFLFTNYYDNYFLTSLFLDFGNLWDTNWHHTIKKYFLKSNNYSNPNNIQLSMGIQIKWISPIGPFVLSYSLPILYTQKDMLEPLQFNINYNW